MKNFTKQNFKTNPLWIRLLIMTFMLLAGAGTAWGDNEYGMQYLYVNCKSFTSYTQVNADMFWQVDCNEKAEYKSQFPTCPNDNNVFYVDLKSLNSSSYSYYRAFEISQGSGWWDKKCFSVPKNNKNNAIKITNWATGEWSNFALTPSSVTLKVTSGATAGSGTQSDPYLVEVGTQFTLSASGLTFNPADPVMLGRYSFGTSTNTEPTGTSTTSTQTASSTANTTKQYYVSVRGYYNGAYSSSYKTASVYVKTVASCVEVSAPDITADAICAGDAATLKLNNKQTGVTYKLNSTSGTTIFSSGDTYTTPALNENTTYKIYASHASACTNNVEGTVIVTVNPIPSFTTDPTDKTMCEGETSETNLNTLSGVTVANGSAVWYTSENGSTTTDKADIVNGGTYWVAAENSTTGCKNATRQKFVLTVNPKPSFTTNPTDKTMCKGETSETNLNTLSGVVVTNGSAVWYTSENGSTTTDKADIVNGGTYWVAAENSTTGCKNATRKKFVLTVVSAPTTPSLSANRNTLNTANTTATLTIGNYVSGVTYTLYKGENSTGETTIGTTFTVDEGGAYKVKGTNSNNPSGCQDTEFSKEVTINVCPTPAKPQLSSTPVTACGGTCTTQGYIIIGNMSDYDDTDTFKLGNGTVKPTAEGKLGINSTAYTQYTVTVTNSCGNSSNAQVEIAINDNKPTITGNNSFKPGGNTVLTSDKGVNTIWKTDGGTLSATEGASVTFSADANGKYTITAIYNGCETEFVVSVQDDIYVWMRKPNKKENAYNNFYYINENPTQGGMMYYKEFTSKPTTVPECNQGGREKDKECTDKEGYTWYGYVISKEALEANSYYFTVHAENPGGKNGFYTHTLPYKLENVTSDLYFVMDETGSNDGWYINAPVVVRASGDASFNGNNFADFVPLYVKDANTCTEKVTSFEWQKSDSENGTYTKYKSGEGINNIRTREAGWYRCKVTYLSGNTATSNAIQVTNTTSGTPGTLSFTSNLPIIMVNTNGVGFPDECTVSKNAFPSSNADKMKEKISVDVIIKKGDNILYDKKARMNYRGSSSLNFKKKSYAFVSGQDSCVFDKSRHDYVKTKKAKMLNILGVANYEANDKDWVLYAATADPSMIRNRLVFDLYQKMRPGEWGVHSTYVELVVDGEYKGVYVFMDKVTANEERVNIVDGTGFIVKFDKTDIVDRESSLLEGGAKAKDEKTFKTTRTGKTNLPTYDTTVDQLFEIEYPEKEDIEDEGGSWASTLGTIKQRFEDFETALEAKNYEQVRAIIDYDSWADWFILNEYTKNLDAYRASCIFTCKGQGYKIQATPLWDQELSFDNAAANISGKGSNSPSGLLIQHGGLYGDGGEKFKAPFWFTGGGTSITGGLLNDPCFISLVKEKWATYTAEGGVLTSAKVNAMVDAYKADLGAIGTAGTPIYRENAMIPFNDSSNAGRGATSSCTGSKAIGYFGYGDNCGSAVTHDNSVSAIKNWIPSRISGFSTALDDLKGEALIFLVSPAQQDVTPWQTALVSVQAPSGYTYSIDYSAITNAGGEVKNADNTYSVKLPRPDGWDIGGNGNAKLSKNYEIKASIELEDEGNTCGVTATMETKTATITLKDEIEACDPVVTR